jgi:ankyrin repeat protein
MVKPVGLLPLTIPKARPEAFDVVEVTEQPVSRSFFEICDKNDFPAVVTYLQSQLNGNPRDFFILDQEKSITALHLASIKGHEHVVNILLDYLKCRDPEFAKEMLLAKYQGEHSSLALTMLGQSHVETAWVLFKWANKLGVDPMDFSEGMTFTKLFKLLNSFPEDDELVQAVPMLLRTMACLSQEKMSSPLLIEVDEAFDQLLNGNLKAGERKRLVELRKCLQGCSPNKFCDANPYSILRSRTWSV